jgi:phosphoserine phosphatase
MKVRKEVKETEEVNGAKEHERNIAAFFDLDGTLLAPPSLERRFFRMLRYRREIPTTNYFLWLMEALRLLPRGVNAILHANKMYLQGVHILDERGERDGGVSSWHKSGHQEEGQASAPPRRNPRLPVPAFFAPAIERLVWHAKQGHEIVVVTGTLEPLAWQVVSAMEDELAVRGITARICVCATRLEEMDGKWTGRISGEAMFGEAKARAAKWLAGEMQLDLGRCYAYGDSLHDRWWLAVVGKPAAVNPSKDLLRISQTRGWQVLHWNGKENRSPRGRESRAQRDCPMDLVRAENAE